MYSRSPAGTGHQTLAAAHHGRQCARRLWPEDRTCPRVGNSRRRCRADRAENNSARRHYTASVRAGRSAATAGRVAVVDGAHGVRHELGLQLSAVARHGPDAHQHHDRRRAVERHGRSGTVLRQFCGSDVQRAVGASAARRRYEFGGHGIVCGLDQLRDHADRAQVGRWRCGCPSWIVRCAAHQRVIPLGTDRQQVRRVRSCRRVAHEWLP